MPNQPSEIPQPDDGGRLARLRARNLREQLKWHDVHHADPSHSCNFKKNPDCPWCKEMPR